LDNLDEINSIITHIDYDDGFVAYINGVEIARKNMYGFPPVNNQGASAGYHEAKLYRGLPLEEYPIDMSLLQTGANIFAIQCHNYTSSSSDLSLIPFLSANRNTLPQNPPNELLEMTESYLHTSFKLNSMDETLYLCSPAGTFCVSDSIFCGGIAEDISIGRTPDGAGEIRLFRKPTPGDINRGAGFSGVAEKVRFSQPTGFYTGEVTFSLFTDNSSGEIHFTTNGDNPTINSPVYCSPITISETSVIRARAFKEGIIPSKTTTQSFFFESSTLPVVSLITNPDYLFDEEIGMYVEGDDPLNPNFFQDWERPVHVEFFEMNGELGFNINAGLKMHGNGARRFPQKSLAIFFRAKYGPSKLEYKLFPDVEITSFDSIILRNSGQDWFKTMFLDAYISGLYKNNEVLSQGYRPVNVYINGAYWGIANIREKVNESFIAAHNNISKDEIEFLEKKYFPIEKNNTHYLKFIDFIADNDISLSENYLYVQTQMDVTNFINSCIIQIFACDLGWPGKNIKYWRHATDTGKWRWIRIDMDYGFGSAHSTYQHETMPWITDSESTDPRNPPWSTLLLRKLLTNATFEEEFVQLFCDHLNTTFSTETLLEELSEKRNQIVNEIDKHILRWQAIDDWEASIDVVENFAINRPDFLFGHFQDFMNYSNPVELTIEANMAEAGTIHLNSIEISEFPWSGKYFTENSLSVTAVPNYGYRFVGWQGLESTLPTVDFTLNENTSITALFEELSSDSFDVLINEINYNSAEDFDTGDWIELYNPKSSAVDISGWEFRDEDDTHVFTFAQGQLIPARGFLVLCQTEEQFRVLFSEVDCSIGNFDFGLSGKGELLRLFYHKGVLIDSVEYDDEFPWAVEPDGMGATL
ncbi:MAG: CotH kinase family protein, partial [Candidatus Cloacimonetes bacterium]|nr:CotH kinase family protein [Candidatus Cloacimonadota bacterium]